LSFIEDTGLEVLRNLVLFLIPCYRNNFAWHKIPYFHDSFYT